MTTTELSIEREKGFEPSTSTLARWRQVLAKAVNRAFERRVRASAGPDRTLVGHRGVREGVGASADASDVFQALRECVPGGLS
jgi:hypothetical protein